MLRADGRETEVSSAPCEEAADTIPAAAGRPVRVTLCGRSPQETAEKQPRKDEWLRTKAHAWPEQQETRLCLPGGRGECKPDGTLGTLLDIPGDSRGRAAFTNFGAVCGDMCLKSQSFRS